jgi:hypothetical protein
MLKIQKDFWAGLMFFFVGALGLYFSREFPMGTATKMGSGYFPKVLCALLCLIGIICCCRAMLQPKGSIEKILITKAIMIIFPVFVFGAIIKEAGLVPASFITMISSALASIYFKTHKALVLAITITVLCWLIFSVGLGLPLPAFGNWITQG